MAKQKTDLEFLPIDTYVYIKKSGDQLGGFITGINISGIEYNIKYEVTWWSGAITKTSDWFHPYQLSTTEPIKTKTAGFLCN